jgi:hypothetical protein|tara:strand:- start:12 stop:191 length:180 start_codon:yes stop_codon:yes gene_type:complete
MRINTRKDKIEMIEIMDSFRQVGDYTGETEVMRMYNLKYGNDRLLRAYKKWIKKIYQHN